MTDGIEAKIKMKTEGLLGMSTAGDRMEAKKKEEARAARLDLETHRPGERPGWI
jgi:hypothetical protein